MDLNLENTIVLITGTPDEIASMSTIHGNVLAGDVSGSRRKEKYYQVHLDRALT